MARLPAASIRAPLADHGREDANLHSLAQGQSHPSRSPPPPAQRFSPPFYYAPPSFLPLPAPSPPSTQNPPARQTSLAATSSSRQCICVSRRRDELGRCRPSVCSKLLP